MPATAPTAYLPRDHATFTHFNNHHSVASRPPTPTPPPPPLASPGGLPPTPPSQDGHAQPTLDPPPLPPPQHPHGRVHTLLSSKSSLSTPINARSPPTPDPSPPRTVSSSHPVSDRPLAFANPESRAESFRTACEDLSSNPDSADDPPMADRLSTVQEDRGLGLAFEHHNDHDRNRDHDHDHDHDVTPTNSRPRYFNPTQSPHATAAVHDEDNDYESPRQVHRPDRDWNTDLMRNVTVRQKRTAKSSPQKDAGQRPLDNPTSHKPPSRSSNAASSPRKSARPAVVIVDTASPSSSTRTRHTAALRERVEASNNSPVTPSMETFAQSIGWPSESSRDTARQPPRDASSKRMSTASTTSTMVEAMVILTPPRRHQLLRHSGKNMAYRRDVSSPAEFGSDSHSSRNSLHMDDAPLHRLAHKRLSVTDRQKRVSTDSGPPGYARSLLGYERPSAQERPVGYQRTPNYERNTSPALSLRSTRTMDSSRHTLAHQESVRRVLQPAADILSRSSTLRQPPPPPPLPSPSPPSQPGAGTYHRRNTSAPESVRRMMIAPGPRNFTQLSPPPQSPPPIEERTYTVSPKPHLTTPASRKQDRKPRPISYASSVADTNKTLPHLPVRAKPAPVTSHVTVTNSSVPEQEKQRVPSGLMERVRRLVADHEGVEEPTPVPTSHHFLASPDHVSDASPLQELSPPPPPPPPPMRRGSRSSRGRPGDRRWSMHSQERSSVSPEVRIRPSLDRMSPEDMAGRSQEWRRRSADIGRVSFDLSTIHSEEHANARHLYAQGTPFSQMSDTLEVSEATAVSIYPHNNHSLLVVQQVPRRNSIIADQPLLTNGSYYSTREDPRDMQSTPTPPFVDASERHDDEDEDEYEDDDEEEEDEEEEHLAQPTLNVEPSTPPMDLDLPQPDAADSLWRDPQDPPEPPIIMFIPPTPAEELERQLVPGPPKRSDSHPQRQTQRRANLVQRARRYSGNLITPLLARASVNRRRQAADSHRDMRVPSVNDETGGSLHPFWRPRGFWDGFEESDEESDGDDALPSGGDTSDIEDDESPPPSRKRTSLLGRKLTSGLRGSGGFLIGNSLGVERHGTNQRRHHITLPPHFPKSPRTLNDPLRSPSPSPPRRSLGAPDENNNNNNTISQRRSTNSLRSHLSYEAPGRRASWRQGRSLPGIRKYQVQYIGLTGVKENFRERRAEKRRTKLRNSIGSRFYVEP